MDTHKTLEGQGQNELIQESQGMFRVLVLEAPTPVATTREVETNTKIVIFMKDGLAETRHYRNEQK